MSTRMFVSRKVLDEHQALITELRAVCKRHGLSLEHEDGHGGFLVNPWSQSSDDWLAGASPETEDVYDDDAPAPIGKVRVEFDTGGDDNRSRYTEVTS